ncbi:MAG: efflux RND transporter permease subunit, partial [Pseudomonadota bacterium]
AGHRDEMLEVVIDPLRLEAYNVTANELINVVVNNNQLIAAGEVETAAGAFAVKIPSSFDDQQDVYELPIKVDGDRVVTLGDLADIRLTFEDRAGTARFNGETTVALQVVKRKGFNIIDTSALIREEVAAAVAEWPSELQNAVTVSTSNDQSRTVASMVSQLEGSVLTAIALVMIVVLAALGPRSALLVGFAIPTSFLLCFVLLGLMGVAVSNIVMFGLILAVGMLVDGAIVVVEYADKRISEGAGPMQAFTEAAKRMFWPIVSSTATTLCAFLPMLFWPGVPGEFMGMLPVTLIFVLSASLVVALIYLPVMGGISGRLTRLFDRIAASMKRTLPWFVRALLVPVSMYVLFVGAMQSLNSGYLLDVGAFSVPPSIGQTLLGFGLGPILFVLGAFAVSISFTAATFERTARRVDAGYRRTIFGRLIAGIAGNPVMPVVSIVAIGFFVVSVFGYFGANNNGVEFFVESEPEQAIVYVRARGNLSIGEKDALVRQVEDVILQTEGIDSAFAFAGAGGLNANTGGASGPIDTIGQVQIELIPWEDRAAYAASRDDLTLEDLDGDIVVAGLQARLDQIPGIRTEVLNLAQGPASAKPVHLRLSGDNWDQLQAAVALARGEFETTPGLIDIEDTLPLPGIDWQIDVDVEKAGRYGASVATVGGMVQLVTRGILLDTMRVDSSDDEIEIRVRLPEQDRVLSTLDTLKVRTEDGLVPLSNFITRQPVKKLAQINRVDQVRYFDVKADVSPALVSVRDQDETRLAVLRTLEDGETPPGGSRVFEVDETSYAVVTLLGDANIDAIKAGLSDATFTSEAINPNERIALITEWLETRPLPNGISYEWTGDAQDQEESGAFLQSAFMGALGLMFIILLAQFNSFYNAALVLLAVILSTTGVLIGMLVMNQPFSIIMTGTGIVAL